MTASFHVRLGIENLAMSRIEPTLDPRRSSIEPAQPETSPSAPPEPRHDTLCIYLAKQFIAKMGFDVARVPEVMRLYELCEVVLTRSDGYTFGILCMVDRNARPNATFSMGVEELRTIGQACVKYAGKLNGRTLPVSIQVLEVGPKSPDQAARLQAIERSSIFAKVLPSAMIVDPVSGEVWSNGGVLGSKGPYHGFVEKIATAPRENDADLAPPAVAIAPAAFPVVTAALLLALTAVFAAEIIFGIGPWTNLLQPSITTLIAFGGLTHNLVLVSGEWYRLLSGPFLHADAGHIAVNAIALALAGRTLERLIGPAWFGVVYVSGAVTGSLASLALNPPATVSVGASGAIMGLFAAMLVVSAHFPSGAIRTGLQMNALYVLIPSLVPLAGALKGQHVDYAAHFGGAVGGMAIGLLLLFIWSKHDALPRFRQVAAAVAVAGVLSLAYPILSVLFGYQTVAFSTQLVPPDQYPKSNADFKVHAEELIARYPRDPRPRLMKASDLLNANDLAGAEREARAGLTEERLWQPILPPQIDHGLRVILAIVLAENRRDEALSIARPACNALKDGPMRRLLDERKLCGT
jgi:rhomboid protease GluP